MNLNDSDFIQCPYCWERIEIELDNSVKKQSYVEDCHVCCQPILIRITRDEENGIVVTADRENE